MNPATLASGGKPATASIRASAQEAAKPVAHRRLLGTSVPGAVGC